jgi:hypothetical protein
MQSNQRNGGTSGAVGDLKGIKNGLSSIEDRLRRRADP